MKYIKTILTSITLLVALVSSSNENAWATSAPYTLKMIKERRKGGQSIYFRHFMQLKNAKSGRVVWTQEIGLEGETHWSKDGRAVAIELENKVFVWREGEKLRRFLVPNPRKFKYASRMSAFDYAMGCVWSPDNERLLIRFGGSASTDIGPDGVGVLFCLKFKRGYVPRFFALPSKYDVWKTAWRDNRTALYWPYGDSVNALDNLISRPRSWRVP